MNVDVDALLGLSSRFAEFHQKWGPYLQRGINERKGRHMGVGSGRATQEHPMRVSVTSPHGNHNRDDLPYRNSFYVVYLPRLSGIMRAWSTLHMPSSRIEIPSTFLMTWLRPPRPASHSFHGPVSTIALRLTMVGGT